ncbi:MAG: hypothetical protein J6U87_04965 [Clostridia bacterium]|nr:hypothetical protein [Clostridia bacterium]
MKRRILSALALLLVLCMLFVGCANHGKTMIEAGDHEISVNVFQLYLSRMKGTLAQAGENVGSAEYWKQYVNLDGQTYSEFYTQKVLEGLKQIGAALYLFDELGLSVSSEAEDAIDAWIEALIEQVGEGSETKLNSILSTYGANVTVLRDACLIEAKLDALKTARYGQNGSLISATAKEEFYQQSYYRGYQMQLANFYFDREVDADGNTVYYQTQKASDGTVSLTDQIAYDTKNGVASEEDGKTVYRVKNEDGSLGEIAYDKENGGIKYFFDENGDYVVEDYTDAQMAERYELLVKIAEECQDNEQLFLKYVETFSDNVEFNKAYAPNGMYFAVGGYMGDGVFQSFSNELAKLEVGDLVILQNAEGGYNLLMRAELDKGAWAAQENSRWFQNLAELAMEYMLQKETAPYLQYVTVDEELAAMVDITMVAANNYY